MANHFTNRTTDGDSAAETITSDRINTIHVNGNFGTARVVARLAREAGQTSNILEIFDGPTVKNIQAAGSLNFSVQNAGPDTSITVNVV